MTTTDSARSAIWATGLGKTFGEHLVLDGVDLEVREATVFALLGANGAGKSTTVNILSTLTRATTGQASVAGHDVVREPDAVRAAIGVTGQFSAVDTLLSGRENLLLMADLHHYSATDRRRCAQNLLEMFDLVEAADRTTSTYSGGMRRRLDLAMTLVGRPRVIFLDEPTAGLDPRSRRTLWQIVRDLVAEGITVFLTTQYLEEADQLADRVAVLDGGRIVAEGTPADLKRRVPGAHVLLRFGGPGDLDVAMNLLPQAVRDPDSLALRVPGDGSLRSLKHLLDLLDAARVDVETLTVQTPDLDDVFLALTHDPLTGQVAHR